MSDIGAIVSIGAIIIGSSLINFFIAMNKMKRESPQAEEHEKPTLEAYSQHLQSWAVIGRKDLYFINFQQMFNNELLSIKNSEKLLACMQSYENTWLDFVKKYLANHIDTFDFSLSLDEINAICNINVVKIFLDEMLQIFSDDFSNRKGYQKMDLDQLSKNPFMTSLDRAMKYYQKSKTLVRRVASEVGYIEIEDDYHTHV